MGSLMSLLKTLFDTPTLAAKTDSPAPKTDKPIVERKAVALEPDNDMAPNHDPDHPNHEYRQHLLKRLKERNPHVYHKIMSWN